MAGQSQGLSTLLVGDEGVGHRLDRFLAETIADVSRAKLQKLIAAGDVCRNGKPARAKDRLELGDRITVVWTAAPKSHLEPVAMPLAILFEDDDLIVLNKPAGLAVHPGAGPPVPTLVHGLLHHCGKLGRTPSRVASEWERPGIVHRLDKETSGVLVCAKSDWALAALQQQFRDKTKLRREYVALLDGAMMVPGLTHESYLHRDPKDRLRFASVSAEVFRAAGEPRSYRWAKSQFYRERVYLNRLTFARIRLFTGRTHQIRVHAKDLKMAVLGDPLYHVKTQLPLAFPQELRTLVNGLGRQLLHAEHLVFEHPRSGERLAMRAQVPDDFQLVIDRLEAFRSL